MSKDGKRTLGLLIAALEPVNLLTGKIAKLPIVEADYEVATSLEEKNIKSEVSLQEHR